MITYQNNKPRHCLVSGINNTLYKVHSFSHGFVNDGHNSYRQQYPENKPFFPLHHQPYQEFPLQSKVQSQSVGQVSYDVSPSEFRSIILLPTDPAFSGVGRQRQTNAYLIEVSPVYYITGSIFHGNTGHLTKQHMSEYHKFI